MDNPDYIFVCKKCGHQLYTSDVDKILNYDCPKCGEEANKNWIFSKKGNWKNEQKTKDNK